MKKLCALIVCFTMTTPVWASENLEALLNKVTLQLHAEQWITTKTALVNVGINAAVTDQGIEKVQNEVMQKLAQLANSEWHILSFDRQQDKSGLESIQIVAQARLQQNELGNLRDKAKAISKPGETFTIDDVQFTPSEDEVRQANVLLRGSVYQQAKAEIDTLNKSYPDQKYYLHQIDFMVMPPMAPAPMAQTMMYKMDGGVARGRPPLSVGNKAEIQATIVLAAMPDQVAQRLTQKI